VAIRRGCSLPSHILRGNCNSAAKSQASKQAASKNQNWPYMAHIPIQSKFNSIHSNHSNINSPSSGSGSTNFNINATHISVRSGGSISCTSLPITLIREINNANHGHNSHNKRSSASVSASVNVSVRSIGSSTITSAGAGTGSSSPAHGHGGLPVPVRHIQPQHSNGNVISSLKNSSSLNSSNSNSRSTLPVLMSPHTLLLLESQHRQMQSHDTDNGNNIHSSLGSG
jgi:hypothetical protein